jgi:predicted dehydrogenase
MTARPRYRAALIGLGRIADTIEDERIATGWIVPTSHMASYMEVPEVRVVGAADVSAEQRAAFASRWSFPAAHLYERYVDMLEREQPQIVSVCTSAVPRARIVLDIARLRREGRAPVRVIWAEKPLAVTLAEGDAMVSACREAGIVLITNTMRSSDVYYRRARALIDAGELGAMLHVTGYGHGGLANNGVHLIGAMAVLAGGPERNRWVVGHMGSDAAAAGEVDAPGSGFIGFENGATGFFRTEPSGPAAWTIEAIGTAGMFHIRNGNDAEEWEFWRMGQAVAGMRPTPVRHVFPRPQRIWSSGVGQVRDAIQCLETGKAPNASGELGLHLLEVAIAARESHRCGNSRIDLPLADRKLGIIPSGGEGARALLPRGRPAVTGPLAAIARREGVGARVPVDGLDTEGRL